MSKCEHNDITVTPFKGVSIYKCNDCGANKTVGKDGDDVTCWRTYDNSQPTEWHMLCCQYDSMLFNTFIAGDIGSWVAKQGETRAVVLNSWPITKEAYELHKKK